MMIKWLASCSAAPFLGAADTVPNPQASNLMPIGMLVIMVFMMYFLVFRPQRQKQKQLQALLEKIKPGDKVLTGAGIVGTIVTVKDKTVTLRSGDTKLEILKGTISEITEKAGDTAVQS